MDERAIRDYLVNNLWIIDPKLVLVEKEHRLINQHGSKGYIDILAKDETGMFVVIEIKRSNNAAREAIHEFFKYVGLLQANYGLSSSQFRCVLLSTDWHELAVPFSEYKRDVGYQVDGYKLVVNDQGLPSKVVPFVEVAPSGRLELSSSHTLYLYETFRARDENKELLNASLKRFGLNDFAVLVMERPPHKYIQYPFALYLLIAKLDEKTLSRIASVHEIEIEQEFVDENPNYVEEVVVENMNRQYGFSWDTLQAGYPEKFSIMLQEGWTVKDIIRSGKLSSTAVYTENVITELAKGISGSNAVLFFSMARPRFSRQWDEFKGSLSNFLRNNDFWLQGIMWFLAEIEQSNPNSTVSVKAYHPGSVIQSLYFTQKTGNMAYLPAIEIAVHEEKEIAIVFGGLEWDGRILTEPPMSLIGNVMGSVSASLPMLVSGLLPEEDSILLYAHGLHYFLLRILKMEGQAVASGKFEEDDGVWVITSEVVSETMADFFQQNSHYLRQLFYLISSFTVEF